MKDTRVNLRISEDIKEHLLSIAESNNLTVSEVIRNILNEKLIENKNNEDFEKKIMEQKLQKIKEALSEKNSLYLEGNNLNARIFYENFDINLHKNAYKKIFYFIEIQLYKDNEMFMDINITQNQKFEFKYGGFLHITL